MRLPHLLTLLLCAIAAWSCNSTETGNPWKKDGDGPTIRSLPLRLTIASRDVGVSPTQAELTNLDWKLGELEAVDCNDQGTVTSFSQQSGWGSGSEEEARLPETALCRLIVRGTALESSDQLPTTPGAFIQGRTEAGPFKLMAPAPVGAFLQMLDPELDLTRFEDLRLELSEERLMSTVEELLENSTTRAELLQPGSQATQRLSEALGNALDLVDGEDAERRVLATSAQGSDTFLCEDYCRISERKECSAMCDLGACQQKLADEVCGAVFADWAGCLLRSESSQLDCGSGTLVSSEQLCAAHLDEYEACAGGGGQ